MGELYYLSFRDVTSLSTGVTAGEVYRQTGVDGQTDWSGAALNGGEWVPWADVAKVFQGKRVCFIVHGFNVTGAAAVQSCGPPAQAFEDLGALALDLTGADIVVPVLWPGDGFIAWSYFTAFAHCKTTGARFTDFLRSSAFDAASVSFISHSLGARVVLETISQTLAASPGGPRVPFDTAVLMAAAVDDNALDSQDFAPVAGNGGLRRIVVLSSMTDNVLEFAFPLGDDAEGLLFVGYAPDARALGRYGPAFAVGSQAAGKTEWYAISGAQDHGDYLPKGGPPPLQGWSAKPEAVGYFCQDVFNEQAFGQPQLNGWATDNTGRFRSGWSPKF
jgi:hypothetical protein